MRTMCWLMLPLALSACPSNPTTTMTGDVELQEVFVSGALLGGDKGGFRIELTGPAPSPIDITIANEFTGASFPTSVQIPAGKSVVEGEFTTTRHGEGQVTFAAGSQKLTRRVVVLAELVGFSLGDYRVQSGAEFALGIYLPYVSAKDVTVTLTSADTNLVTVPATATIPRFSSSTTVTAKAGTMTGTGRVTANYAGITRTGTVAVTNLLSLTNASVYPQRVLVGGATPLLYLNLSGVPASDVAVTLTSSDTSVLTVPATVTFRAGNTQLQIPVTTLATGTARITAQAGSETRVTNEISVRTTNSISNVYCSQVLSGQTGECSVSLDVATLADAQLSLSADTSGILTVPATINIPAGSSSASFSVTGQMVGSTRLTVNLGAASKSTTVQVINGQQGGGGISYFYVNNNGRPPGTTAVMNIGVNPAQSDRTLTITSSNAMVFSPPTSVSVPAGTGYVEVSSVLQGVGQSLVTLTLGSVTLQTIVSSSNAGSVYLYLGGGSFELGAMQLVILNLPAPTTIDTMITLSASMSGVIDVPTSVLVPAGESSAQFVVRALMAGETRLNASYQNQYFSTDYRVVTSPTMSLNVPSVSVGRQGSLSVSFDCVLARDRVVTLSQMGTGRLNMASSVIVGTSDTTANVYVTGATAGDLTVTATLGTEMKTEMTTVSP